MKLPVIIQGGMGVAISNWTLAKAVSQFGQMGVVSGTGMSRVLASRLTDGDLGGHVRRALESFPLPEVVRNIIERYYIPGGKATTAPYKTPPAYTINPPYSLINSPPSPTMSRYSWQKRTTMDLWGSICLKKYRCPTSPRSTARCWPGWIMC